MIDGGPGNKAEEGKVVIGTPEQIKLKFMLKRQSESPSKKNTVAATEDAADNGTRLQTFKVGIFGNKYIKRKSRNEPSFSLELWTRMNHTLLFLKVIIVVFLQDIDTAR